MKFLGKVRFVADGVSGLMKDGGSARRAEASAVLESVGGSLEIMYYAFGEVDAYFIADVPDAASAAAASMVVNASGAVEVSLTPLLTVEEMDEAAQKSPDYSPPGT